MRGSIRAPRHRSFVDEILEDLLVPERVHWTPEAVVLECHELVGFDQSAEGRFDQLIAFPHVLEDLFSEDEETAIYPEIGILTGAKALDFSTRPHLDEMEAE